MHALYPLQPLAEHIELPAEPDPAILVPALADALNHPLSSVEQHQFNNDSFVDDNGISAIRERIVPALQQSLLSAFLLFGWPCDDR
jgi:hypothetical protein